MEKLSPEARAIYEILTAETREAYENRFLDYKKESFDAVRTFVEDTTKQFANVNASIATVQASMGAELAAAQEALGADLATIKAGLSAEISQLAATVGRAFQTPRPTAVEGNPGSVLRTPGMGAAGPSGHCVATNYRGMATTPPPGGGTNPPPNSSPYFSNSVNCYGEPSTITDANASAPRIELPQFDGANPKLWQRRCEEYYRRWSTPQTLWVPYGTSQFTGAAATWLESFLRKTPQAGWDDLVRGVMARFMRNQHTILLRRFYHISQSSTVEDYVQRFSDLVDQLSAYEPHSESIRNMTRFLDGLKPAVRVLVAIQQPDDLDTAFTLALLYEELGEGANPFAAAAPPRQGTGRNSSLTYPLPPPPPAKWVSKSVEEKKQLESTKGNSNDKWSNLKAYRMAKGLCFVCGEKWGDIQDWLRERTLVLDSVKQHLLRMQQRMKSQADKKRSERVFSVGDKVFLKLQPYLQSSVLRRANHKLAFKFFGPFQVPLQVLRRRVRQQGLRTIVQGLVQWSGKPESMATWEDLESLQQKFPHASAWGQADCQERGDVNDLPSPANKEGTVTTEAKEARPRRQTKTPARFKDYRLGLRKPM
ncbi:hypothetical protein QYE76_009210 [Lolium multiflorum]|uniref:Retrotransposon gag domain-containing protein n=1 Tax=Lolium multiflorum TaxID=4521 RepID=A0AAD8TUM7_LOLMU|nr:hypothetical protein QYE76_009210 [Lolium multiflorum]